MPYMDGKDLQIIMLLTCLVLVFSIANPGIEDVYSHSSNVIEGDFSIIWFSKSVLYYDEFYVVAPNAVFGNMSLIYGKDIVCRSLSVTISSLGVYVFRTAINGSQQYVHVDGGVVKIQLTDISTGSSIVDQFIVPGLYAIYVSITPSVTWTQDPATGAMTRWLRLTFHVEGYGIENVIRSYNISDPLPTIGNITVDSLVYNALNTINHYIVLRIEYLLEFRNILIVFVPSVGDQQQTVTTVTRTVTITTTTTSPPVTSIITATLVLEKTVTKEITYTSTVASIVPEYTTVLMTIPITTTVEKAIERSTIIVQTVEKGYNIYTLISITVVSVLISVALVSLFVFRRRL